LESTVKEIQQKMDEAVKEMAIQKMEYQNKMHDLEVGHFGKNFSMIPGKMSKKAKQIC
jgi:hypothetical protein